ncbi:hypothetical protein ABK040_012893 [Willaertia magna]
MAFSPTCYWQFNNSDKRIVLIADPQMEGDGRVYHEGTYGQLNNDFNDLFYHFIFQNVYYFKRPDHVYMLGDLFSSQYIDNEEFSKRLTRYRKNFSPIHTRILPNVLLSNPFFSSLIINEKDNIPFMFNLTGNHDVGYGVEVNQYRMNRFTLAFGPQNRKDILFRNKKKEVWSVIINSMVLDGGYDRGTFMDTWSFLNETIKERDELIKNNNISIDILLFTHIPLHKPKGVCVDGPYIKWHGNDDNKLPMEQNFLTPSTSNYILNNLRPKFIFNGHDHFGCFKEHLNNKKEKILEYTVRSILGDFGGNVALFEFKEQSDGSIEYSYKDCRFYPTQMIVGFFIVIGVWLTLIVVYLILRVLKYILCCEFVRRKKQE